MAETTPKGMTSGQADAEDIRDKRWHVRDRGNDSNERQTNQAHDQPDHLIVVEEVLHRRALWEIVW